MILFDFYHIDYSNYLFLPVDNSPPTITCAANINRDVQCRAPSPQVSFPATAIDNCGVATVTYTSQGSTNFGSQSQSTAVMNEGFSTVTATATDTSGRSATCSMQVRISEGKSSGFNTICFFFCPEPHYYTPD